ELTDLVCGRDLRLLTLTGPGGSGKTRLAIELGWELVERFRDGVAFVELGPVAAAELVPATVAQALGLRADTGTWERLAEHLRDKRALLVLDNFEHVLAAAACVSELVRAAPELSVLATSRTPLNLSDEREYRVEPLPVPRPERVPDLDSLEATDAAAFFLARARAARPEFAVTDATAPTLAKICIRLDGLPLALELAAPRLKVLSPEALLERLGRSLELAGRARDVPDRQRTLRATIAWTHELLATPERELFPRLAVFRGGFSIAAAEAVAGWDDPVRVEASLLGLVDWNLVASVPPRLRMLETIREYGLERLSLSRAEQATRARHARFFLALAERAEPELRGAQQAEQLRELDEDNANLREALAWFHLHDEAELGLRLVGALWRFWQLRGQLAEGRQHAERLLAGASGADSAVRSRALACAGRLAFFQGDYGAARRLLDDAYALQAQVRDAAETALLIINFGMLANAEGRRDDARALLERGAEAFRAIPDAWGEANALAYLALVEHNSGHVARARELFHRSHELADAVGEKRMAAFSLTQLGAIAREDGNDALAARLFERALAVQWELGDTWSIASSSTNLAALMLKRRDCDRAQALLDQSLALQWEAGNRPGIAASLERLADVALERGDIQRAVRLIAAADALYASIGASRDAAGSAAHRRAVQRLRDRLDDDALTTRWAAGASLTPGAAVALAMDHAPA
ncbi:MAG: ATP-binding protein, partial [Anaeromyxobacteraceae bacterium]